MRSDQWHVDQNRKTNVVRGILRGTCNWALSNIRDKPTPSGVWPHILNQRLRRTGRTPV
jgi:hypothetical protein